MVALRAGHDVHAQDINPWAVAGMKQMLALPSSAELERAHTVLGELAAPTLRAAYATSMSDGRPAEVVHTYRVAIGRCSHCATDQRQFPYSMLTLLRRKEQKQPAAILACRAGHVFHGRADEHCQCPECGLAVDPLETYTPRRRITCAACGAQERLSERAQGDHWRWESVLVERACPDGREFGLPTQAEFDQAEHQWNPSRALGAIPPGAETRVLLRHGFANWEDLYPLRQRAVTETLLELAAEASEEQSVVEALRMAIVGTIEFAGYLCRWDRFYLKCNDAMAGHRFNFSTFVPEINVWGAGNIGRGTVTRRVRSMVKSAAWLQANVGTAKAEIVCQDSSELDVPDGSFDLVLTDPPYHDDVHYGELSLPFRAWAGLPMADLKGEAAKNSVTGLNPDRASYALSLERIFAASRRALRDDGRLVFSYANHDPEAWVALFTALQSANFSALACISVHSENETDFKKRDVKSCTEDLLLELSPVVSDEDGLVLGDVSQTPFMQDVALLFTRVGRLPEGWQLDAIDALRDARSASTRDKPARNQDGA